MHTAVCQIYFHLLSIYHNSKLKLVIAPPKKTQGKGDKENGTNACHSSLITSVTDTDIDTDTDGMQLRDGQYTDRACKKLNEFWHLLCSVMDSTVELPRAVNDFDIRLEGPNFSLPSKAREEAMKILNQVSSGDESPEQGMKLFLLAMKTEFDEIKQDYVPKKSKTSSSNVRQRIFELQLEGTFKGKLDDKGELTKEYQGLLEHMAKL